MHIGPRISPIQSGNNLSVRKTAQKREYKKRGASHGDKFHLHHKKESHCRTIITRTIECTIAKSLIAKTNGDRPGPIDRRIKCRMALGIVCCDVVNYGAPFLTSTLRSYHVDSLPSFCLCSLRAFLSASWEHVWVSCARLAQRERYSSCRTNPGLSSSTAGI